MSDILKSSTGVLETHRWNNVIFSYDNASATINMYVNGALVATKTNTVEFTADKLQDMIIGRDFKGSIDALKIFKKSISQEDAFTLADEGMYGRTTKSTMHTLAFDNTDKVPGSFYDKSNDVVYAVKGGSATYEDGVNSSSKSVKLGDGAYISLGDSPIFNNAALDDFAVSAWINLDENSTHANQKIFYKQGVVDLYIDNNTPKLKLGTSSAPIAFDQSPSEAQSNPYIRSGMFSELKSGGYEGPSDVLTLPKISFNGWVKKDAQAVDSEFNPIFIAGGRLKIGLQDDKLVTILKPLSATTSLYTGTRTEVSASVNAVVRGDGEKIMSKARSDNVKVDFASEVESATSKLQTIEFKTPSWKNTPASVVVRVFSADHPQGKVVVNEALEFRGKDHVHKFTATEQIGGATKYEVTFAPTENGIVEVDGVQFASIMEESLIGSVVGQTYNTILCEGNTTPASRVYAYASLEGRDDTNTALGSGVSGADGSFSFTVTDMRGHTAQATGYHDVYFSVDRNETGAMLHYDEVFSAALSYGVTWTQSKDVAYDAQDVAICQSVTSRYFHVSESKQVPQPFAENTFATHFPAEKQAGDFDMYREDYFTSSVAEVNRITVGPLSNFNRSNGRIELVRVDENDEVEAVAGQQNITSSDTEVTLSEDYAVSESNPTSYLTYRVRWVDPDLAEGEPNKYQYLANPDGQSRFLFMVYRATLSLSLGNYQQNTHHHKAFAEDRFDAGALPTLATVQSTRMTSATRQAQKYDKDGVLHETALDEYVSGQNFIRWTANVQHPELPASMRHGPADGRVNGDLGSLDVAAGVYRYSRAVSPKNTIKSTWLDAADAQTGRIKINQSNTSLSESQFISAILARLSDNLDGWELYSYGPQSNVSALSTTNALLEKDVDLVLIDSVEKHVYGATDASNVTSGAVSSDTLNLLVGGYKFQFPDKTNLTRTKGDAIVMEDRFSGGHNWKIQHIAWPNGDSSSVLFPTLAVGDQQVDTVDVTVVDSIQPAASQKVYGVVFTTNPRLRQVATTSTESVYQREPSGGHYYDGNHLWMIHVGPCNGINNYVRWGGRNYSQPGKPSDDGTSFTYGGWTYRRSSMRTYYPAYAVCGAPVQHPGGYQYYVYRERTYTRNVTTYRTESY